MGGECGMYGDSKNMYRVWWEELKEREYMDDLGMVGEIILK
jgi:hypothetical protein